MEVIYLRVSGQVKESLQKEADKRGISLNAYCNLIFHCSSKIVGGKNG